MPHGQDSLSGLVYEHPPGQQVEFKQRFSFLRPCYGQQTKKQALENLQSPILGRTTASSNSSLSLPSPGIPEQALSAHCGPLPSCQMLHPKFRLAAIRKSCGTLDGWMPAQRIMRPGSSTLSVHLATLGKRVSCSRFIRCMISDNRDQFCSVAGRMRADSTNSQE